MKLSPSQFGLVRNFVQSLHLTLFLGAEKGVVLAQVGGDEFWVIALLDYFQEHVCGCL